jgi:hypothetical protein
MEEELRAFRRAVNAATCMNTGLVFCTVVVSGQKNHRLYSVCMQLWALISSAFFAGFN